MTRKDVIETLGKQLQLLSKRSSKTEALYPDELSELSRAMCEVATTISDLYPDSE